MGAVALGAILFAILLLIVALMVAQEVRRTPESTPTYVIEEVVPYVFARLGEEAAAHLDRDDVTRILEWEVRYLLRRADVTGEAPVAGSTEGIRFIRDQALAAGHDYAEDHIAEVLGYEADYLAEIGALGPPVGGEGS